MVFLINLDHLKHQLDIREQAVKEGNVELCFNNHSMYIMTTLCIILSTCYNKLYMHIFRTKYFYLGANNNI